MLSLPDAATLSATYPETMPRADVLSLRLSLGTYADLLDAMIAAAHRGESRTACFANVHMTVEAANDEAFAGAVNGADWVLADGVPLTWALRMRHGIWQERLTGLDVLPDMLQRAEYEQLPVFFYGSTPEVLAQTVAVCARRYPALRLAGTYSPPFRPLTEAEETAIVERINASGARLVLVALGCPKQEQWMARMRGRIEAVMLGIGGALPVLAGVQSRAPIWMQRAGLEWLYRLSIEPNRLFKRYALTNAEFVLRLLREAFRMQPFTTKQVA